MGWTGINTSKSFEQVFKDEFCEMQTIKSIFLKVPQIEQDIYEEEQFVVFKHKKGYKFIGVILWQRNGREVLYKNMDESMGPYTHNKCPKEILDAATPLDKLEELGGYVGYAKEWRERQ